MRVSYFQLAPLVFGSSAIALSAREDHLLGLGIEPTDSPSLFPNIQDADTAKLFPMAPCGDHGFQLEEATIDDMQAAMANGTLTSVQLVTCYMIRTYQTNEYIK